MKNSEEAMEKVLAGLRDAEAPAGMERRILDLDALEERAAARSRSGWRQMLPVWLVVPARPMAVGSLVCGVALAGLFAVALAIPAFRRLGHAPVQARKNVLLWGRWLRGIRRWRRRVPNLLRRGRAGAVSEERKSRGGGECGERGGLRSTLILSLSKICMPPADRLRRCL